MPAKANLNRHREPLRRNSSKFRKRMVSLETNRSRSYTMTWGDSICFPMREDLRDKIKHGLTRKMLKVIRERLILTKHQIIRLKQISTALGIIMVQNLTKMLRSNFNSSIINSHQEEINLNTPIRVGRDISSLGINGLKMQRKPHTRGHKGINRTSKVQALSSLDSMDSITHSNLNHRRKGTHPSLTKRRTLIGESELQELLSVPMNLMSQQALPRWEEY